MKINLNGKEYTLLMSSLAVEEIEEKYDKPMGEIFTEETKLRARDVNFILYSALQYDDDVMASDEGAFENEPRLTLEQFKKYLAKEHTYEKSVGIMNELLGADTDPNEEGETDTEVV